MTTIYLTKYMLTSGVTKFNLTDIEMDDLVCSGSVIIRKNRITTHISIKDVAYTLEEVDDKFEEARTKELKRLDRMVRKISLLEVKINESEEQ